MDRCKKPRMSAVESSEENFNGQKKSAAFSLDQKSGTVRLAAPDIASASTSFRI